MVKSPRRPAPSTETRPGSAPPLPPNASVGKRWRFQRNMAIYVLHRHGFPQRRLADIFDLPRSSIGTIIKTFSEYA